MPDITVDFSSIEADEFSIVTPGDYACTIVGVKYDQRESETEETYPYLNIDMTIDEGQNWAHSHLYYIASFSPKGGDRAPVRRTKFLLMTLGVNLTGPQKWNVDSESKALLMPDITGQSVQVRVVTGKNSRTGEPQANITRIKGKAAVATANGTPSASAPAYK